MYLFQQKSVYFQKIVYKNSAAFFVSSSFWYCFLSLKMKKDHCSSEDSSYVVVVTVARIFQILSKNYEALNLQKYDSNTVRAIITHGFYTFYPLFEGAFSVKFWRYVIKSGLWWRAIDRSKFHPNAHNIKTRWFGLQKQFLENIKPKYYFYQHTEL